MFVADFIGSPPMNFLHFEAGIQAGDRAIKFRDVSIAVPEIHEQRAAGPLVLGVRPEHIRFSDAAPIRGRIFGAEYLGTTQIVTVDTEQGRVKARLASSAAVQIGETVGLAFQLRLLGIVRCAKRQSNPDSKPWEQQLWLMSACGVSASALAAVEAVRDLSLTINDGEFVVLLGPSGAGKTTTLRLISGLERPDNGSISINGRDVTSDPPGTRDIAFVFQQFSLYPHLTVYDNLAFPLRSPARRVPEPAIRKRVEQTAELLHITGKLGNRATRLSGGEMQRVAIGRALVRDPAIYLMDEPLSSLDAKLRAELRLELKRIQVELGATILYVTHDQIEAMTMASRIGVIKDGALLQLGTPREIYENPSDRYVASRLGTPQINFLPAKLIPEAAVPSGTDTIGIRTEYLQIARANGGGIVGRVHRIEHLGDQNHVHLEYRGEMLVTLADPHQPLQAGQDVELQLIHPLYFDAAGRRITATVH